MPSDKFFIAPYDQDSGLQTDVKPWLISDQAFSELNNVYVFRGRVRKRFGSRWIGDTQLSSRLGVNLGNTDGSGNFAGSTPQSGGSPLVTPAIGQTFSVGTALFTVVATGNPANMLRNDGVVGTATFDTTTGAVVIHGAAATTAVIYYPALPVMGLVSYETGVLENEPTIAFDTKWSYQWTGTVWNRISGETTPGAATWHGSNSQFFWPCNYFGATDPSQYYLFVTNYNQNEPNFMRVYNGTNWDNFRPTVFNTGGVTITLDTALILVPFQNVMVAMNTFETTSTGPTQNQYQFRIRWSGPGSPQASNAWRQDIPGQGQFLDLPVNQAIVTAEFIKNRLIIFCEESTWELVYTGNRIYPFAVQQLNTELGAESTFSVVPFDKVAFAVGNVGIESCNGSNVERIDAKIPDEVFKIHQLDAGINRVYGIRDYYVEMVYWTFPGINSSTTFPYPNRVLVYNYRNNTWAFNDDSITCFGYFQPQTGITWSSTTVGWSDTVSWSSGASQALFRQVIAGNQEGYVFIIDPDEPTNAPVLQVTNISVAAGNIVTMTVIDHNFQGGEFIYIQDIVDNVGNLQNLNHTIQQVQYSTSATTFTFVYNTYPPVVLAGTYAGGGILARVSRISISTKEYNFYAKQGKNAAINRVDFMVDTTDLDALCSLDVNFYASTNDSNLLADGQDTGAIMGESKLDTFPYPIYPYEANSTRKWSPVYIQGSGEVISLTIQMNDEQMMNVIPVIDGGITTYTGPSFVPFQLHAMIFYANAIGRLE